jgi:hypothetical protein
MIVVVATVVVSGKNISTAVIWVVRGRIFTNNEFFGGDFEVYRWWEEKR